MSMIFKISLLLSALAAMSIVGYYLISSKFYKIKQSENIIEIIQKNDKNLMLILLNSERAKIDNKIAKSQLSELISSYDYYLPILKKGGIAQTETEQITIKALDEEIFINFTEIEKEWNICKLKIETIINEPSYNYIKSINDSTNWNNGSENIKTEKVQNQRILSADEYIVKNFEKLFNKQNEIIQYYKQKISETKTSIFIILIILSLLFIATGVYLVMLISENLVKPIVKLSNSVKKVSQGKTIEIKTRGENSEFFEIIDALNKIAGQTQETAEFINYLKEDKLNFEIKNYKKENILQNSLLQLRDKLIEKEQIEERRKIEEKHNQWSVDGQAKFNEILRTSASNMYELSDNIIKNIVKFLNAAQGGLFIVNNRDKQNVFLELISAFAYDRKKYLTRQIPVGEGLLGMCALEKNTVWLDKIPNDYIEIESGLGESNPSSLLMIPLKTDTELLGVIEIASFNKFTITEVKFVENIARSIASTIATTKITEITAVLLKESQKKSEELASRDNEMTLKIEELRNAQEDAKRNQAEMLSLISAVDRTLLKAELSMRGKIMSFNKQFINKTNYHSEEVKNRGFVELLSEASSDNFDEISKKVKNGETVQITQEFYTKQRNKFWVISQYTPIRDEKDEINRILFLGNDISHEKVIEDKNKILLEETILKANELSEKEKLMAESYSQLSAAKEQTEQKEFELRALITAIDYNLIKLEFNTEGKVLSFNYRFASTFNLTDEEIYNTNISEFLPEEITANYEQIIKNLLNGETFSGIFSLKNKQNYNFWWIVSLTPVKDISKKIIKILLLANDITPLKKAEEKIKTQAENLEEQEKIMIQNMEEMMEKDEILQNEFEKISQKEQEILNEFESEEEKKYYKWLKEITKK